MSRSDRDSSRRNRALPAGDNTAVDRLNQPVSTESSSADSEASHSAGLHSHFGNTAVSAALNGEWADGLGPVMADGLDFAAGGMGASEEVGVSPSNSVMLRAMRDAFQATNYNAEDPILNTLRPSGGEQLPEGVRARFEAAMGHDLGHVRIHRDGTAASQSDALNAYAFTIGSHIWFGGGRFDPESVRGKQLLAHELTHVKQHDEGRINPHTSSDGLSVSSPNDPLEVEAYAAESAIAGALPAVEEVAPDMGEASSEVSAPEASGAPVSAQAETAVMRDAEHNPHSLEHLHDGSHHQLSDAVIDDFRAAANAVRQATGQDISQGLGDTIRPLQSTTTKAGASNWSWHKTGRAFDINQNLPWVITEQPAGDRMYFRLFLMARGNAAGRPTVQFQRGGDPALYFNGVGNNAYRRPFVDVTAILAEHGWSRIPAQPGYSRRGSGYNKQEWWHYEQRDDNSWYSALDEVFDRQEIRDGLGPLQDLRGAENRMRAEGVPEEEIRRIRASRNERGPAPRQLNVAPPGNSHGSPLPSAVAEQLRAVLGDAVDQVRVHTGREAASFADNLNANAVTVGTDVFFNAGRLDVSSEEGLKVLAEEVHHAIMGGGGPGVSQPNDPHERQAKGFASEFAEGLQAAGGLGPAAQSAMATATSVAPAIGAAAASADVSEAMGGLSTETEGTRQSPVETTETAGLGAMAASAHQDIPDGMEPLLGAMGGAGAMARDMAAEVEAEKLPMLDADAMSQVAEPGQELSLSTLQNAVGPTDGLPPDMMGAIRQVSEGELDPASAIEQVTGESGLSTPSLGGLTGALGGGMSRDRRRGTAKGSLGLSRNASGPAPTAERDESNEQKRDEGGPSSAETTPSSPTGVQTRSPVNANHEAMSLGASAPPTATGSAAATGGGAQAPQSVTPKEPVRGTGTGEHATAVADAVPSLKAASYATTAGVLDGHAKTESGQLHESIPEFSAVMTEDGVVESAPAQGEGAKVDAPQAVSPETSETGVVEQVEVAPTVDPGEFASTVNTAAVAGMSEEAPEGEREQAVSQAIRSIQTEDGAIDVSPGAAPQVAQTGDTDPARADRDRDSFVNQATTAAGDARQAVLDSPGSERVVPLVMNETYRVESLELGSITGMEGVHPEVQKLLDSTVSGDVITSFDTFESPAMEASHQVFEDEVQAAVEARDTDAQAEIEATTAEADRLVAEANAEQQATVAEQRGLIEAERQRTIDAGQTAMSQFNAEARAEHARVSGEVRGEISRANNQVAAEYARAESEATREVSEGEAEAQRRQAEAERQQEDQSWWQKAADWVADQLEALADAISNLFNAIRDAVTAILDAVKELATSIIDAAVSFICEALAVFGEFLKAGIDLLLGSVFPELADALNQFVDAGVAWSQERVTALGEQLKAGIDALVSAITDAMNAIIDVFNAAVQGALAVLQAVVSGDWVQILLALLEAALRLCGINPDEFYGMVGRAEETIDIIVNNPGQFIGNLIDAVGAGFGQFADNFMIHLQNGFMEWLTGQAGAAGIELPESFDLKGLVGLGMQILGLTYDNIRAKAVEHFGEEVVEQAEFVVDFLDTILEEGIVEGLWTYIEGYLDGVWDAVIGGIQEWIAETIIRKAVVKIASMFNPVGAIVQALLTAWDLFNWVKDNVQQIYAVVTSVVSNIHAIATGAIGGAADMIEGALGSLVPVAIDLLAKVLGLGNAGDKVSEFIQDVQEPINEGLDQAFGWLKERVDSVADFITGGPEEQEASVDSAQAAADGDAQQQDLTRPKLNGAWGTPTPILYAYRSPEGDQITPLSAHGTFALEITDAAVFETQWKSGEAWDNSGIESFIRTQVVSQFTPIVANANAAVPDVAAPNVYAGYSAATQAGVNNNLTGFGVRVRSVTINTITLNGGETNDLDEQTGEGPQNKAFLEARQGFQADGHTHHTWIDTVGGGFTVMVASRPTPGLALLEGWTAELNTNRFDNDQRAEAATALREGRRAITSLHALQGNVTQITDDTARQRVEGLIRDKQELVKTHVGKAFTIFGDDTEITLEWALSQPGNELAKHKWDQITADAGRNSGLSGVLPTFTSTVETELLRVAEFADDGTLGMSNLLGAMRTTVASAPSTYLLRGDPIAASTLVEDGGGLGRCMNLGAIYGYNYDEDLKKEFLELLAESDNPLAKSNPRKAWTHAAIHHDFFNPDTDMVGNTQGTVPQGWWFALNDAQGVDPDELREALTLTDPAFDEGYVKLSFPSSSFVDAGFKLYKPTAFDGIHQGWASEPMWASTGPESKWGLTKSVEPVREGVAGPIPVASAQSRDLIRGSVDAAYDVFTEGGVEPAEQAEAGELTEPNYLEWMERAGSIASTYLAVNQTYMSNRTQAGFAAARSAFRTRLEATGWGFGNSLFVVEWGRYMAHNEHVGWGEHQLPTESNPEIKEKHQETTEYEDLNGAAYVRTEGEDHAVSDEDVKQGALGDCYWMAGMAAVAKDNKTLIERAVSDNGDGTYDVTLYDENNRPVTQTIDGHFPVDGSTVKYARPAAENGQGQREMWPLLMEKAFANMGGGYEPIEGGFPGEAVRAITGKGRSTKYSSRMGDDEMAEELATALNNKQVVTAWTASDKRTSDETKKLMEEYQVYANHAYSFREVDVKNGTVSMRNPWGSKHPKAMPMDVFRTIYPYVDINEIHADIE